MMAFFTDIFARLAFKNTIFIAKWQRHTIVWRHFSMLFARNRRYPTVKINENNIRNANTIKITPDTPNEYVAAFIRQKILPSCSSMSDVLKLYAELVERKLTVVQSVFITVGWCSHFV